MDEKSDLKTELKVFVDSLHKLDDEEELGKLLRIGEGKTLEFKTKLPAPKTLATSISSFANAEGGLILFGIDDSGTVVGLNPSEKEGFSSTIQKTITFINPTPQNSSWKLIRYKDKIIGALLVFYEGYKPFFVEKRVFKRVGTLDVTLEKPDLIDFPQNRSIFKSLRFDPSVIKSFLSIADEDAFTEVLLVPFLRHLGFRSVLFKGHRDKTLEFGQDIRSFKFQLPTGHWLYFAAQVKTDNIMYSPMTRKGYSNIVKVLSQAKLAFNYEMFDIETNTTNLPDHLLLVTTKRINEGARLFLSETLSREKIRRILVWEGEYLYERINELGLPPACQSELEKYVLQKKKDSSKIN
jgi:hypothetical protein